MARARFEVETDEVVLLATRPHWLRLVPRLAPSAVLLGGCVAIFVLWAGAPAWFGVLLLATILAALGLGGGRVLSWRSTSFVVTSARLVHRHGVLRRTGREIPIVRVQDVTYHQGILGRLVGLGEIRVASASGSTEAVADLRRPERVQRIVNRALEEALRRRAPGGDDIAGQLERLDALRRQGVVTDAEFDRKKAELLARM